MILQIHGVVAVKILFNLTDEFKRLNEELTEAFDDGDFDDCVDIIADIEQGRKCFNENLPDWYHVRWSTSYVDNPQTWLKACEEYTSALDKPSNV